MLKISGLTVAIVGTKILADASKHSEVNYGHAGKKMRALDLGITALIKKSEQADTPTLDDGLTIPEELQPRVELKAKLASAQAEVSPTGCQRTASIRLMSI